MVLADLGSKISNALRKLNSNTIVSQEAIDTCLKEITNALIASDVNIKFVLKLKTDIIKQLKLEESLESANSANKRKLVQSLVVSNLVDLLTPEKSPYKLKRGYSNVIMFVGLQGSGKTTSCAKFALYYKKKGWRVAMVCADTFRAGAFDQLKQNCTKIKIPFYGSYVENDPVKISQDGVDLFKKEKFDLIIVDTSGRHKQSEQLLREMSMVSKVVCPDDIIYVMDSHIGQSCADQASAFRSVVDVGSVIVTKLDGHAKGGGALSAVAATNSPIIFVGTGEHFENFEPFSAKSFISRLLGLGDIEGLVNTIKDVIPTDKAPEMMNRLSKGIFTLRDMYEQFANISKMGSMGQVMSMIPGMNSNMLPQGAEEASAQRIRRFMIMMDSMSARELDETKSIDFNTSRIIRIARGSGCSPKEVEMLLDEYKKYAKMVGKMGKMNLGSEKKMQNLMKNPAQLMQTMGKVMDPQMLNQMGGAGNIANMMKQMEGMDGMKEMMAQMKGGMKGGRRK